MKKFVSIIAILFSVIMLASCSKPGTRESSIGHMVSSRSKGVITFYADNVIKLTFDEEEKILHLTEGESEAQYLPAGKIKLIDGKPEIEQYFWRSVHQDDIHLIEVKTTIYKDGVVRLSFPRLSIDVSLEEYKMRSVEEDMRWYLESEDWLKERLSHWNVELYLTFEHCEDVECPVNENALQFSPPADHIGALFEGTHMSYQYITGERT